jgi:hypothetical protein
MCRVTSLIVSNAIDKRRSQNEPKRFVYRGEQTYRSRY